MVMDMGMDMDVDMDTNMAQVMVDTKTHRPHTHTHTHTQHKPTAQSAQTLRNLAAAAEARTQCFQNWATQPEPQA